MQDPSPKAIKPRKKRIGKTTNAKNQPSLDGFARRQADVDISTDEPTLDEDLNLDRRKRRKTTPPTPETRPVHVGDASAEPPLDLYHQLQAEAELTGTQDVIDDVMADTLVVRTPKDAAPGSSPPNAESAHQDIIPESSLPLAAEGQSRSATPSRASEHATHADNKNAPVERDDNRAVNVTPKKQIKVTKTGKLVSSPPKKQELPASTIPKRRGRPRKAARTTNLSSTITIIKYGFDKPSRAAFGQKLDAILNGKSAEKHVIIVPPKPARPPKAPHPFFKGKAGQKSSEELVKAEAEHRPVTPRKTACTPGKLRAEMRREQDEQDFPSFSMPSKNSRQAKQSGLYEPLWPSKETAHVRNLQQEEVGALPVQFPLGSSILRRAKRKRNVYTLSAEEEIVTRLSHQLPKVLDMGSDVDNQRFTPPEDVRLPKRQLTTGIDIQHMVRAQIKAPIETLAQRLYARTHPAITTLFDDIEHTLTPFDEGRCETQAWAQKYRPGRADHVLQPGKEAAVLKDWLKSLTVMAVGAAQDPSKARVPTDTKKPPRKKRKTAADDFIVFSDEEDEDENQEMVELESDPYFPRQQPSLKRPCWTRNKNVVLLSGPHGCGKSATVYAVAKELEFEVFELHSGVRRSGKDIQDKVGDMTANHLVNHQRSDAPTKPKIAAIAADNDTDNERDTAFQKDLDSGRQGTMTSFFTAKPATKSKLNLKPKAKEVVKSPAKMRTIPAAQAMLPIAGVSRKSQKQSLILIEEADILFEEDQNFWAHIIKLAAQSKRPIVITCNEELHIPTQALPMAAVLRLTPPPVDLATDYLVALAGREGHLLQRETITNLYISKDHDLRASITDLSFWCQMSVGDKKGGLEWMYQRWPPGKDVNANGRLLRVASDGTYHSGMGWLSHNVFESDNNVLFDKEEEMLREVWNDWSISPTMLDDADQHNNNSVEPGELTRLSNLDALDRLVSLSDALSAVDMYSRIDLPSYDNKHDEPMDPTLPQITPKERLSYTIDAPLLQVDPRTDFLNIDTALATTTHLLCRRAFPDLSLHHSPTDSHPESLEQRYTAQILRHKTNPATQHLSRSTFSSALDVLATPPSAFNSYDYAIDNRSSYNLLATSLDRPFSLLTLDIAPYVRSIVAHELALEAQRIRLGSLLSEGGRAKRGRTTRAARSAVEGGERQVKRRERWFHPDLSFELVMRTAGSWAGMGWKGEGEGEDSVTGTQQSESLAGTQRSEGLAGSQKSVGEPQDVEMVVDADVE